MPRILSTGGGRCTHSLGRHPPWADTPLGRHPTCFPGQSPPRQTPPETATAVDSMHPAVMLSYYCPQTKFAKVMFLHLSVSHSVHRGVVSEHALQVLSQHALQQVSGGWYPSMPCRFPGPHPRGKLREITQGVSRPTPGGVCSRGVPAVGRGVWRPPVTATAGGGTHPTGMHSCFQLFLFGWHVGGWHPTRMLSCYGLFTRSVCCPCPLLVPLNIDGVNNRQNG